MGESEASMCEEQTADVEARNKLAMQRAAGPRLYLALRAMMEKPGADSRNQARGALLEAEGML